MTLLTVVGTIVLYRSLMQFFGMLPKDALVASLVGAAGSLGVMQVLSRLSPPPGDASANERRLVRLRAFIGPVLLLALAVFVSFYTGWPWVHGGPPEFAASIFAHKPLSEAKASEELTKALRRQFSPVTPVVSLKTFLQNEGFRMAALNQTCEDMPGHPEKTRCWIPAERYREMIYEWSGEPCDKVVYVDWAGKPNGKIGTVTSSYSEGCLD